MEGLADDILRGVLTRAGRYDWCVTEFVRVTGTLLPRKSFTRVSPELLDGARTAAGTPVRVQLMGSDPPAWRRTRRAWPSLRRPASTSTSAARRRW
jgi:tRNA-dihydrouridine synthase C